MQDDVPEEPEEKLEEKPEEFKEPKEPKEQPEEPASRRPTRSKRAAPERFTYVAATAKRSKKTEQPTEQPAKQPAKQPVEQPAAIGLVNWNAITTAYADSLKLKKETTYEITDGFKIDIKQRKGGKSAGGFDAYVLVPESIRKIRPGMMKGARLRSLRELERFQSAFTYTKL
jgi:hypothetical protein